MLKIAIFLLIIIVIILFLLLLNIKTEVEYCRNESGANIRVTFSAIHNKIKYNYEMPATEIGNEISYEEEKDDDLGKYLKMFRELKGYIKFIDNNRFKIEKVKKYVLGKVKVESLNLNIVIGTGDAFYTGIATGVGWSIIGIILSFISNNITVNKKVINVTPEFNRKRLHMNLICIFNIKFVHIIVVLIKIALGGSDNKILLKKVLGGDVDV